jgi:hypothetical protein
MKWNKFNGTTKQVTANNNASDLHRTCFRNGNWLDVHFFNWGVSRLEQPTILFPVEHFEIRHEYFILSHFQYSIRKSHNNVVS